MALRLLSRRPARRPSRRPALEALEDRTVLYGGGGQAETLLAPTPILRAEVAEHLTAVGGTFYFLSAASSGEGGLWKTDGTVTGTQPVREFRPGRTAAGVAGSAWRPLVVVGGALYFVADDGAHGAELWRSDGTSAGTVLVKDIFPGPASSSPLDLTVVGNTLYFTADDGRHGVELWKSDGTTAGTVLVRDLYAGVATERDRAGEPNSAYPHDLVAFDGALYFTATDGQSGAELWTSDGTAAGTRLVADLLPGSPPYGPVALDNLTAGRTRLYFTATSEEGAPQLWATDGTRAGTRLLADFGTGIVTWSITDLVTMGDRLYFSAGTAASGQELWRSDGAPESTRLVKDIVALPPASYPDGLGYPHGSYPHALTDVRGTLYFVAAGPDGMHEALWRSDGTTHGTVLVADLPGPALDLSPDVPPMLSVGPDFYFVAATADGQAGLWRSDGTTAGTARVAAGGEGGEIQGLARVGDRVLFSTSDRFRDTLWALDAAETGPVPPSAPPPVTSVLTSDEAWLGRVYLDLLGRPADAAGQAFWVDLLRQGADRLTVVQAIEGSPEHDARVVRAIFRQHLGRDADPSGLGYFVGLMQAGVPEEEVRATVLGSEEFLHNRGGNSMPGFIRAVYQDTRGTEAPAGEAAGPLISFPDRAEMARSLMQDRDYGRHRADALYQTYLRRRADAAGREALAGLLVTGAHEAFAVALLLASDEYYQRS